MKISLVLSVLLFTFIIGCKSASEKRMADIPKEIPEENSLQETDIFDMSKVWPYINLGKTLPKTSTQNFLRGIDHLKNTHDTDSAIYLLRASILNYPSLKAYYELGNAYYETSDFKNAMNSYQMAEKLGYEPFGTIMFQIAKIKSVLNEVEMAGNYLEYAIQSGFVDMEAIATDTSLRNLRSDSYIYDQHLEKGLRGLNEPEKLAWIQFKKSFTILNATQSINQDLGHELLLKSSFIPYSYEKFISEMRDEKFSREISKGFYYGGQIAENANYTALIYITKDEFISGKSPLTFTLATYTNDGRIIDKKVISSLEYYNNLLSEAKFTDNKNFEIVTYTLKVKETETEEGYPNYKIESKSQANKEKFTIAENGKIIQSKTRVAGLF